jgi:hypothetical protein
MNIKLTSASDGVHKYEVTIDGHTIKFGAKGYSDFTQHHDIVRKKNYIARHKGREDWTKAGLFTAGFWSKHILWNKPSVKESLQYTIKKFNLGG